MKKEDWLTIAKWIGYAYVPIALFALFVFFLVLWQRSRIESAAAPYASTTAVTRDR
jgi:hypothetical protein